MLEGDSRMLEDHSGILKDYSTMFYATSKTLEEWFRDILDCFTNVYFWMVYTHSRMLKVILENL